jgi:hypothetical protein
MQEDVYSPHTWLQECLSHCLYSFGEPFLTRWPISYMRKKALQQVAEFLKYEDENSQYICIGAAQKVIRKGSQYNWTHDITLLYYYIVDLFSFFYRLNARYSLKYVANFLVNFLLYIY